MCPCRHRTGIGSTACKTVRPCKVVTGLATFSTRIVTYLILIRRAGTSLWLELEVWHLYKLIKWNSIGSELILKFRSWICGSVHHQISSIFWKEKNVFLDTIVEFIRIVVSSELYKHIRLLNNWRQEVLSWWSPRTVNSSRITWVHRHITMSISTAIW